MTPPQEQNSEWIEHDGKGMPVDGSTLVYVMFRDGAKDEHPSRARIWGVHGGPTSNWEHSEPTDWDIVAYRLHSPTPSSQGDAQ